MTDICMCGVERSRHVDIRHPFVAHPNIRCETCGGPNAFQTTKRCNGCWEVEHRLGEYLRSANGQAFVREKLGDVPQSTYATMPEESSLGRSLVYDLLAHIAELPELQDFWKLLPPRETVSGYERVQDTWLCLLGHIPTYLFMSELQEMIDHALPDVVRDLVRIKREER